MRREFSFRLLFPAANQFRDGFPEPFAEACISVQIGHSFSGQGPGLGDVILLPVPEGGGQGAGLVEGVEALTVLRCLGLAILSDLPALGLFGPHVTLGTAALSHVQTATEHLAEVSCSQSLQTFTADTEL